jgi:hypothetical protein
MNRSSSGTTLLGKIADERIGAHQIAPTVVYPQLFRTCCLSAATSRRDALVQFHIAVPRTRAWTFAPPAAARVAVRHVARSWAPSSTARSSALH